VKVLMVHLGDGGFGGGDIAMIRLQGGLRKMGVESRILCQTPTRPDSVAMPPVPKWERLLGKVTRRLGLNDVSCLGSFRLKHERAFGDTDVLDLHCIHSNFFSYLALPTLTQSKPTVFTFHDMWPFTGHCHTSRDCERWRAGCGKCPYLDTYPPVRRDATRLEWKLKRAMYERSRFAIVTPSSWLTDLARQSMVGSFPIHHIPHGIDTTVYEPLDQAQCRSLLGIPRDKKVLVFVADYLSRYLKGGDLLLHALRELPASLKSETVLLLLGWAGEELAKSFDIPVVYVGFLMNERLKAMAYNAADLFLLPTRADNFPLTLIESLACGTPIVSFRVGGVPDVVRPGVTGYLAAPENAADFSAGIRQLLEDDQLRGEMRHRCRSIAVEEYSVDLQAQRYAEVYRQVVQSHPSVH